ncbi:retrovirus-related pol polyprotein from transposon TNT 1-94, partial [Tanacetum coccineum]
MIVFDILKQYQKEVNELRAERIAKNANPLALVATAQPHQDPYYQTSKSHKSYAPTLKAALPTRSHVTTRHKGKVIAKPITPPSESPSDEDSDLEQAQKEKEMQKNWLSLQMQQFGIQCFNCKEFGQFAKECKNPKRVKDSTYHQEKMLLCKQAEKGVQLQAEQSDWLADTDEEIDEQELEAHYNYMEKIQEVPNEDSGTDFEPLEQNDQNAVECDDERVALANLIANLKHDVDENKRIQKKLKKANATLTQELTECKSILAETSRTLGNLIVFGIVALLHFKINRLSLRGLLAHKDIDIKEGLKLKAYKISVVKEKHDELVKQILLTKSHYEGLVKEKK